MNINEYVEKRNELQELLRVNARTMVEDLFKNFFEHTNGMVEQIKWTQYTPYFNDGEACIFSVNDPSILPKNANDSQKNDYEENWTSVETPTDYKKQPNPSYHEGLAEPWKTFCCDFHGKFDEVLETCFGDHVEVIVSMNENNELQFTVDVCEHD